MKKPMTFLPLRHAATVCAMAVLLAACGGEKPDAMLASARDYLAKNDPKAAVIQLKNALQANPNLAEARLLLGQALMRGGDYVGAETELRKALELKQPADQVVPVLAQALLGMRQFKKLTDEFSATTLTVPAANAGLKTSLSTAYAGQGKADLAKTALAAALEADPKYLPALLLQARTKAGQGDFDGALAVVETVLANTPSSYEAMKLRGDVKQFGKNDEAGALADFRKALELKPDYLEAHSAIVTTLLRNGKLDDATKSLEALKKALPNTVQAIYFDTMLAFQKKDFKRAKELSQQLIKLVPNSPQALQLAGAIEMQVGTLLQADAFLTKALQAVPDSVAVRRQLAVVYLRSGQVDKALTTLQPFIKAADRDASTNSVIGQAYLQSGDAKKAEEYFTKASSQDPANSRNRIALALSHLTGARPESGLDELQGIAAAESTTTADMALISAYLRRQEFDKALKAIDALEKKQPASPMASNLRGRTLLAKKDIAGARKSFERSLEIDPNYFTSVVNLAALDLMEKKPDDARKRFEAILAKDPKNGSALLALAELRSRTGGASAEIAGLLTRAVDANPTDKAPRLMLVELYLRSKDFKQAMTVAQNGVTTIPDSPELLDALGRAQQASGDTNQALITFNKVAAMLPASPLPQMRIAAAHLGANNKDAANQSMRKALDAQPDFLDAQVGMIALALDGKNYDEATRIARTVQKQRPKDVIGYRLEGDIAVRQKKWDVAADAYRNGLKQFADPVLATKVHGTLVASGKLADAEKFSATWLKDYPKDPVYRLYFANVATASKDFPTAERFFQGVIQLQPNNAVAYNNLAWVSGQLKKDTAIGFAEKAVSIAPQQPAFIDTLAVLLSEKNDYAKAVEWQQKAVALEPQNGLFKVNLAKIHIRGGKKDLARKELDEVAKMGAKYPGQAEVESLLKTL